MYDITAKLTEKTTEIALGRYAADVLRMNIPPAQLKNPVTVGSTVEKMSLGFVPVI